MKLIKLICITLCLFIVNANGMAEPSMPFRVGFEFQMNGRLCEWALEDYNFQKKPIIKIETKEGIELFHVELDGPDIEFVTKPFSNNQEHLLVACMGGIKAIIDTTKRQLDLSPEINFEDWLVLLSQIDAIQIKTTPFLNTIKTRTIKKLNIHAPWEPSWQPQMTVQHPLQSTIALCNSLFPIGDMQGLIKQSIPTMISQNTALAGLIFLTAHEMVGMTRSYLTPLNQDHLVDLAIALTMYFHGQNLQGQNLLKLSINALSDPILIGLETNPKMRAFLNNALSEEDEFAQQLISAIPNIGNFSPIANNEKFMYKAILMRDTFESFKTAHQSDAKRWTNFMSRRPFSHMFAEIVSENDLTVSDQESRSVVESDGFPNAFNKNIGFSDQLPDGFYLANYAEQFFDIDKQPLDLRILLDFFDPTIKESSFLSNLLKDGMISTTMFSLMDLNKIVDNVTITEPAKILIREMLIPDYSTTVLNSIQHPQKRKILHIVKEGESITIDANELLDHDSILDLLSPPFLLDESDSMGQYRKGVFDEEYDPKRFGSAIVEFRNIQQAKTLKSSQNNFDQTGFLTLPDYIEEEALNVFKLLSKLTMHH